jgi:hypothetical protein
MIANGTPVLMQYVLKKRFSKPLDFGFKFIDGNCLFGKSKTWRGLVSSVVITALFSVLIGYSVEVGVLIAIGAMLGDVFSSFFKRRLKIKSGGMAPFLDQVPESILPAVYLREIFNLNLTDIVILVCLFIILELFLSQLLYKWHIRKRPY